MAEVNNNDDQKERSIGEKLRKMFGMEVKPKPEHKSAEDAKKHLLKTGGRA